MKTIYQFGLEGNFIRSFKDEGEVTGVLGIPRGYISISIARKTCNNGQYYLSDSPVFTLPRKKANHNPLKRAGTYLNIDKDIEDLDRDIRSGEFNYNDLLCNLIRV